QLNPTVGDVAGNLAAIRAARTATASDLLVCSELALIGYPPEDLVLRPAVLAATRRGVEELAIDTTSGAAVLVTTPWAESGAIYNAAVLLEKGKITAVRFKHELPNYGVFDEKRVFAAGPLPEPVDFRGTRLGVMICEDMWYPTVPRHLKDRGAELLIVPNGSPFERGKLHQRVALAVERVRETGLALVYVNQVGGQDELVFDGGSFVVDRDGRLAVRLPFWKSVTQTVSWAGANTDWSAGPGAIAPVLDETQNTYQALMLGLRDYVNKNRFPGVLLGLSGGIDSALTAAVAVDALGASRVRGVRLPSKFTSHESQDDAEVEAQRLGIHLDTVPIADVVDAVEQTLAPLFAGRERDITEENIQARARGLLLMAVSNKSGAMLLTTGNKSEMSVGYATLYGDMCGGYSVLKDLYKTEVYALAEWRNHCVPGDALGPAGEIIPISVLTKAPTAELRPNQKDQDSLPEYAHLDAMLTGLVEGERGVDEIAADGFARDVVSRTQNMLFTAEYKRRQAPPGVKTSSRSFGRDRRYPITNRFRER
ncbi:MAG: NAD+ synthase, partial [Vicinamibacterales bacterium]